MNTPLRQLTDNLQKAPDYFRSLGDATDLYYDETGAELAMLVDALNSKLQDESITDDELKRLWLIFAPTCAWDDFRGDIGLGQGIFDGLQATFGRRIDRAFEKKG